MKIYQVTDRPHTYIVENDNQCHLGTVCNDYGRQLGTVDEFHHTKTPGIPIYIARRFDGRGMFEEKTFPGFTAALQFVAGN